MTAADNVTHLDQLQPPSTGGRIDRAAVGAELTATRDDLAGQLGMAYALLRASGEAQLADHMLTIQQSLTAGHIGRALDRAADALEKGGN